MESSNNDLIKPNILFLILDSFRADKISGPEKNSLTPNFDYIKKNGGNKIVGYGATSKSTSVFNYCQIGPNIIDYIVDTTPSKQGRLSPGVHIPIISPQEGFDDSVNYAFLGAWNYLEEITKKESLYLRRGGKFITHVPEVSIL